jgi:hypothetical protein
LSVPGKIAHLTAIVSRGVDNCPVCVD